MMRFAPWQIALTLLVLAIGLLTASPNVLPEGPRAALQEAGLKPLRLGLDLQGGSYLLFEVQVEEAVAARVESLRGEVQDTLSGGGRGEARIPRIGYRDIEADAAGVDFRVAPADAAAAEERLKDALNIPNFPSPQTEFTLEMDEATGRGRVALTEERIAEIRNSAVNQSIEIVRRRIDATGATQPTIQRQGAQRIVVQVPGESDPQRIVQLIGKTAALSFHLVDTRTSPEQLAQGRSRPGTIIRTERETGQPLALERRPLITGDQLVSARAEPNQEEPGAFQISFRLNAEGGRRFGDVTRENVGERFAIVLDEDIISAPVIQGWIPGGSGRIVGDFTAAEANDLAILLRAGALPAPLTLEEQRTISATLGQDSIEAGRAAAVIGLIAVAVFIMIAYGRFGVFANVALAVNIVMILGALSLFQATLTLPGLAGIVLTIGMAVDANVLIFERMREETRGGKPALQAAQTGFGQALRAIVDANVTTFIAAAILYQLGSGPVQGFAVTLAIGVLTSMFTAIVLTRLMVSLYLRGSRPKTIKALA